MPRRASPIRGTFGFGVIAKSPKSIAVSLGRTTPLGGEVRHAHRAEAADPLPCGVVPPSSRGTFLQSAKFSTGARRLARCLRVTKREWVITFRRSTSGASLSSRARRPPAKRGPPRLPAARVAVAPLVRRDRCGRSGISPATLASSASSSATALSSRGAACDSPDPAGCPHRSPSFADERVHCSNRQAVRREARCQAERRRRRPDRDVEDQCRSAHQVRLGRGL